jgi:hypothetical protein
MPPDRIAEVFSGWNAGRLESYLIEVTTEELAHTDAADADALGGGRGAGAVRLRRSLPTRRVST